MNYTLEQIARITQGNLSFALQEHAHVSQIGFDSRKLMLSSESLFVCLVTSSGNGHDYIADAYEKGVRNFLISQEYMGSLSINTVWVKDTLEAFQKIAKDYRKQLNGKVIGITGSYGKTYTKEWLSTLLRHRHTVTKSPKSFNSQIGVPLSICQLDAKASIALLEAGISQPGEMQSLSEMIDPLYAIITNIGLAHRSSFADEAMQVEQKLALGENAKHLLLPYSIAQKYEKLLPKKPVIHTFGFEKEAHYSFDVVEKSEVSKVCLTTPDRRYIFEFPFTEDIFIENALLVLSIIDWLGDEVTSYENYLEELKPLPMRMELIQGMHNNLIINDAYIGDTESLQSALESLYMYEDRIKIVVLSEFQEGWHAEGDQVDQMLGSLKIDEIHYIGNLPPSLISYNQLKWTIYADLNDFYSKHPYSQWQNAVILLKGSRKYRLEQLVIRLEKQVHRTVLEINMGHLMENYRYFKNLLRAETKLMVMVKAQAYGGGSVEVARYLEKYHVDYLGVAYVDEGIELRKGGIKAPIMVLNCDKTSYESLAEYYLEPEIYSLGQLESFIEFIKSQALSEQYPIHLKLDTGMKRLGFEEKDIKKLIVLLSQNYSLLRVQSVFTHLAAADDPNEKEFTGSQIKKFEAAYDLLKNGLGYSPLKHVLNSSGIYYYSEFQMDMCRLGIGLYGSGPSDLRKHLLPISTLKAVVTQIKDIKAGESIGYNRAFIAKEDMTIATISIGYADGLSRAFSNQKGKVSLFNTLCPIVGNVCMDMTMIDVTKVLCKEGDEVVIFGDSPTIEELAKVANTIPYEILTSISGRVKRNYIYP